MEVDNLYSFLLSENSWIDRCKCFYDFLNKELDNTNPHISGKFKCYSSVMSAIRVVNFLNQFF